MDIAITNIYLYNIIVFKKFKRQGVFTYILILYNPPCCLCLKARLSRRARLRRGVHTCKLINYFGYHKPFEKILKIGPCEVHRASCGVQTLPAHRRVLPAGVQPLPAGIQTLPAGVQPLPAARRGLPAGYNPFLRSTDPSCTIQGRPVAG